MTGNILAAMLLTISLAGTQVPTADATIPAGLHSHSMQTLRIEIPDGVMGRVQQAQMIPAAYLDLLARLTGKAPLPAQGDAEIVYNEGGEPEQRIERFGDTGYGLVMEAEPIASGVGVHGETGNWRFTGLPPGLSLHGSHRLDMRGGNNYLSIGYSSASPEQESIIKDYFGQAIMGLIAYDRAH